MPPAEESLLYLEPKVIFKANFEVTKVLIRVSLQLREVEVVVDEEEEEVGQVRVVPEVKEEVAVVATEDVAELTRVICFYVFQGFLYIWQTSNLWHFYNLKWSRMFISYSEEPLTDYFLSSLRISSMK